MITTLPVVGNAVSGDVLDLIDLLLEFGQACP